MQARSCLLCLAVHVFAGQLHAGLIQSICGDLIKPAMQFELPCIADQFFSTVQPLNCSALPNCLQVHMQTWQNQALQPQAFLLSQVQQTCLRSSQLPAAPTKVHFTHLSWLLRAWLFADEHVLIVLDVCLQGLPLEVSLIPMGMLATLLLATS